MPCGIRDSDVFWKRSFQGRFILLDHPNKVNLDDGEFMIFTIAQSTKECGFQAFLSAHGLSDLWN